MNTSATGPLVSVVTPVYNGELYLADCIGSVAAQTYHHWEYIIYNNCSNDRTAELARAAAQRDPRVRLVEGGRHLPMIASWNTALSHISAESAYCKIVHADDMLFPECLERMVALAEANPKVGIVGAYRLNGSSVDLDVLPYPSPVTPGPEACRRVLLGRVHLFGAPTSTLLRADLVRQRPQFYNERNIHADTEVCFELLRSCDWGFVHQVLTLSREHERRNTTTARRLNSYLVGNLIVLLRHGRFFLDEAEYQARLGDELHQYDRWLARNVLRRSGPAFWGFHREAGAQIGLQLRARRLAAALADLLADRLLGWIGLGALYRPLGTARRRALARLLSDSIGCR